MFAWVTSAFSWLAAGAAARFIAQKVLLVGVLTLVLIPLLWNMAISFLQIVTDWGFDQLAAVSGGTASTVCQIVGLGGWVAVQLKIPECVAIMFSFLGVKVTLRMIGSLVPGLKLVR